MKDWFGLLLIGAAELFVIDFARVDVYLYTHGTVGNAA
jgi:hypothetical protein